MSDGPATITLQLLPPGQLLVARVPEGHDDPDTLDLVRAELERIRRSLGMPDHSVVALCAGFELETLTDDDLAAIGLMRRPSEAAA